MKNNNITKPANSGIIIRLYPTKETEEKLIFNALIRAKIWNAMVECDLQRRKRWYKFILEQISKDKGVLFDYNDYVFYEDFNALFVSANKNIRKFNKTLKDRLINDPEKFKKEYTYEEYADYYYDHRTDSLNTTDFDKEPAVIRDNKKEFKEILLILNECSKEISEYKKKYKWNDFIKMEETRENDPEPVRNYKYYRILFDNDSKCDSSLIISVMKDYDEAISAFIKQPNRGFPRKKEIHQNLTYKSQNSLKSNNLRIEKHKIESPQVGFIRLIKLPKVGFIKFGQKFDFDGTTIKSATITRSPSGKWFAAIAMNSDKKTVKPITGKTLGIDINFRNGSYLMTSSGERIQNVYDASENFQKQYKHLKSNACKMSHKKELFPVYDKEGNQVIKPNGKPKMRYSYRKRKIYKYNDIHFEKMRNIKKYYFEKLAHDIFTTYDVVTLEDIDYSESFVHNKFNTVTDTGEPETNRVIAAINKKVLHMLTFGEFKLTLIRYAVKYGKTIRLAKDDYKSTQICHKCQTVNEEAKLLPLKWTCKNCGTEHDLDYNAAMNLNALKDDECYFLVRNGVYTPKK